MAGYICLGMLAAFGLLSVCWCLFGWLLPSDQEGVLLCEGSGGFVHRFLWLRSLGLIRCRIILIDADLALRERQKLLEHGIEICSRKDLLDRLGIGAEEH